jgi:hypothetical protein
MTGLGVFFACEADELSHTGAGSGFVQRSSGGLEVG